MSLKLVIIFLTTVIIQINGYRSTYEVPEPTIRIFKPRGFEVSIPDEDGILLFAFHGNLNRRMNPLEAGEYSKDILKTSDDRWVYSNRVAYIKPGDKIYYWLYVDHNDRGYRLDNKVFTATGNDIERQPARPSERPTQTNNCGCGCMHGPQRSTTTERSYYTTEETENEDHIHNKTKTDLEDCKKREIEVLMKFAELKAILKTVQTTNRVLNTIAENSPNGKMLKVRGRIGGGESSAVETVVFLLDEKLDLRPNVIHAHRSEDNSITFEVGSLVEKLQIIEFAREKLANSTAVQITY